MALGDQIRRARHTRGLSQQAIATHFGISRAAVAQWENGTTRPDQDKLARLAELLGIGLDELLSGGGARAGIGGAGSVLSAAHHDLLEALEYLLPDERAELEADIKRRAAHNKAVGEMLAAQRATEASLPAKRPATAVTIGPPSVHAKKTVRRTGS